MKKKVFDDYESFLWAIISHIENNQAIAIMADYETSQYMINEIIAQSSVLLTDCNFSIEEEKPIYIIEIENNEMWVTPAVFCNPVTGKYTYKCPAGEYIYIDSDYAGDFIKDHREDEERVISFSLGDEGSLNGYIICPDSDGKGFCFCRDDKNFKFKYRGDKVLTAADIKEIVALNCDEWIMED